MSTKGTKDTGDTAKSSNATSARSESPVAPFKHQHSFEGRYAAIINQQILENTINKEVLQRQVQAFFPISRSSSQERTKENPIANEDATRKQEESSNEHRKFLQKLETLDIEEKERTCD